MKFLTSCATVAVAMLIAGPANAADLGGNCCADLEERIAELEATSVRKGNRKVSLTISGFVNESVMAWDDGVESNVYQGTNDVQRSRFRFVGDAQIVGDWKAGYLMEFGVRSNRLNRTNQDVSNTFTDALDLRHQMWYLENKSYGKLSVGLTSQATDDITEMNTANLKHFARASLSKWNGSFFLVTEDGQRTTNTWLNLQSQDGVSGDNVPGEGDRRHEIRYDTPTFEGFKASAAWGEDDFWDVALRYKAENWTGFKFDAGIGYAQYTDDSSNNTNLRGCAGLDPSGGITSKSDTACNTLGMSASLMHEATGLFVTGAYGIKNDDLRAERFAAAGITGIEIDDQDKFWSVQAGIEQKFIALGKTTFYGEYYKSETGAQIGDTNGNPQSFQSVSDALGLGFGSRARSSGSEARYWGLGMNQTIEAAAMDIYIGYRHMEGQADLFDAKTPTDQATVNFKDLDIVMTGAKIQF
jgi:predicted porin